MRSIVWVLVGAFLGIGAWLFMIGQAPIDLALANKPLETDIKVEVDLDTYQFDKIPEHYHLYDVQPYISKGILVYGKSDPTLPIGPIEGLAFELADNKIGYITARGYFQTALGKTTWPAQGIVTSGYGERVHPISKKKEHHDGIDIGGDEDSPIYAIADGKVEKTGSSNGYGNQIVISHGRYKSMYAHLNGIDVDSGDEVKAGDIIGYMGSTGVSTGFHLHLEIWDGGKPIDPAQFMLID